MSRLRQSRGGIDSTACADENQLEVNNDNQLEVDNNTVMLDGNTWALQARYSVLYANKRIATR